MRVRSLLFGTAIMASLSGALVAYLVLAVPNDIASEALLREARMAMKSGHNDDARASLLKVVQQYPRTDAAAAATAALVQLSDQERRRLTTELDAVVRDVAAGNKRLEALTQRVNVLASTPKPVPAAQGPAVPPKTGSKTSHHKTRRSSHHKRH